MTQVALQEPRTVTRLVYSNAIRTAVTDGERADLMAALQWYEVTWRAKDAQARKAAQEQIQQSLAPAPPHVPSAVEQHGFDSPEAETKRQERRQRRLAEKEAASDVGESHNTQDEQQDDGDLDQDE